MPVCTGLSGGIRRDEADRVHDLVYLELKRMFAPECDVFVIETECRVDVHITVYFKNRPLDPDNICSKMYIDGLVPTLLDNDTRNEIRQVTVQSEIDRDNPRLEIEITEVV